MPSSRSRQEQKECLLAWIVDQNLLDRPILEIQAALRSAPQDELRAWIPDQSTLWRWIQKEKARRRQEGARQPAFAGPQARASHGADHVVDALAGTQVGGDPPRCSLATAAVAPLVDVPGDDWSHLIAIPSLLGESASREALVRDIDRLEQLCRAISGRLREQKSLSSASNVELKRQRGWMRKFRNHERGRGRPFDLQGVWIRYHEMRALAERLVCDVNDATAPLTPAEALIRVSHVTQVQRVSDQLAVATAGAIDALSRRSRMPFASKLNGSLGERESLERAADEPWGAAMRRVPRPGLGASVVSNAEDDVERRATIRALLIAPMVAHRLSATETAALWQKCFRRQASTKELELLPTLPEELRREAWERYRKLSPKTLEKWNRKLKAAHSDVGYSSSDCHKRSEDEARIASDVSSVGAPMVEVLRHRNASVQRTPRKLTAPLREFIERQYLRCTAAESDVARAERILAVDPVSAATIHRELQRAFAVEVSERTIQRFIAAHITDAKRILSRGGVAADEIFRTRMIRAVERPNQVWIMDHSFYKRECIDEAHPEWLPATEDLYDFDCAFARREHHIGSTERVRVVRKMSMTLIIDAFSRRRLCLRVWEGSPSTRETLLALRDAMLAFGIPEMLYTDNGSDLTSTRTVQVLLRLGILHVKSMPYQPQGRGPIERDYRTIKEDVLPRMPGYITGPDSVRVDVAHLLEHQEFEQRLWQLVDKDLNYRKHAETGEKPAVRYDRAMGARRLLAPSHPELVALMMERRDAVRQSRGLHVAGGRYAGPGLLGLPEKARVSVYIDPYRPEVAYVLAPDADGNLRFNGLIERYGQGGKAAPQFDVHQALEEAWRTERQVELALEVEKARRRREVRAAIDVGERLAEGAVDAVLTPAGDSAHEDERALHPGQAPLLLPSGEVARVRRLTAGSRSAPDDARPDTCDLMAVDAHGTTQPDARAAGDERRPIGRRRRRSETARSGAVPAEDANADSESTRRTTRVRDGLILPKTRTFVAPWDEDSAY